MLAVAATGKQTFDPASDGVFARPAAGWRRVVMNFVQEPPRLGNQYEDDRVLRSILTRLLPRDVLAAARPGLHDLGELSGGELYRLQLDDLAFYIGIQHRVDWHCEHRMCGV